MRSLTIARQDLWLVISLVGGIVALIVPQSTDALYVLVPAIVAMWTCIYCVTRVWKRDREIPIVDIGVLCVIFTTLYTAVPLLNFYFGGLRFGPLSDARLQYYHPSAEELGLFFTNHVSYLASLAFAYLLFRKSNNSLPRFHVNPPSPATLGLLVCGFLLLSLYFGVLLHLLGIGFKSGYGNESYISEGPLWLQQINGKLTGLQFVFQAGVVALLVQRKNDVRALCLIFLVVGWNVAIAFIQPGSRGELMSLLLLTFLFWHRFHGTSLRFVFIFLFICFAAFMFLGLYRSFPSLSDMVLAIDNFETIASASNEFQSLLGTAFDVHKMVEHGVTIPFILSFNDLTAMLPPQQLLPFHKVSGAEWYLIQIGQDETGVGFMWSVISQSLIGFGLVELIVRGVVLGWFLAYVHRWYQRRYARFLPTVFYVILCLASLWTFRDTTGAILWTIWWQLIPVAFILYLFGLRAEFSRASPNRIRPHKRSLSWSVEAATRL